MRFKRFYDDSSEEDQRYIADTVSLEILNRPLNQQGLLEIENIRVVYRRYASLYFVVGIDENEKELQIYSFIHTLVELLDSYFTNVCELDIVHQFYRVHYVLNAMIIDGHIVCVDKQVILSYLLSQDLLTMEDEGVTQEPPTPNAV